MPQGMPKELELVVQRMIDADESEEDIAAVIRAHNAPKPGSGLNKPIKSATTWGQGVLDSLTGGEAAMAGLKGAAGWAKGAVLNIPKTVMGGIDTVNKLPNPMMGGITNIGGSITNPDELNEVYEGVKATPGHMWETTKKAGSDPVAFGEMMGEITGQPLVGELPGMLPAGMVARATRAAGRGVKSAGSVVAKHAPASKLMPRMTHVPAVESLERGVGRGIANIGDRMSKVGTPKVLQNSDYGPTPYTPPANPISPTADLRGSSAFPETSVTAPEMIPNSQAAIDDFANSVMAQLEPAIPEAVPYGGPIEGDFAKPWGTSDNVSFGDQPNLWAEPSGDATQILNRSPEMPAAREWQPPTNLNPNPIPEPSPSPQSPFTTRGDVDAIVAERVREAMQQFDDYVKSGGKSPVNDNGPTLEVIEDGPLTNNASGESGASIEAMNRLKQMQDKGEVFVVYDKAGRKRPLIGADAVDYVPRRGETFGIQSPGGFQPLSKNGGISPDMFMRR